jgi:transposase
MAPFPPGTGGGEGVAYGRQGQGILIHSLTDATGRPLSTRTTPAHGDDRAQVIPRLDTLPVRTGQRGRPRQRVKVLAADQGDDAKDLCHRLRRRGLRAQIPKRVWNTKQSRGRPINTDVPRYQAERTFAWFQRQYRQLVVRWERLAACFNAFLGLALIHLWVHRFIVG